MELGFGNILSWLNNFSTAFVNGLNNIITNVGQFFTDLGLTISNGFADMDVFISEFKDTVVNKLADLKEAFLNKLNDLYTYVTSIYSYIGFFRETVVTWFTDLGVWIAELPQKIVDLFNDLFTTLFVPQEDHFGELKDKVNSKFPIIQQVTELSDTLLNFSYDDKPSFSITYNGTSYVIFDLSLFSAYRTFINGVILVLFYFAFIRRLLRRIPRLIGGF